MKHYFSLFVGLDEDNPEYELELFIEFQRPEYDEIELGTIYEWRKGFTSHAGIYKSDKDRWVQSDMQYYVTDKMLEKITEDIWEEINNGEYE